MKEIIQHEKYGTIEFTEGNFIANRQIIINGQPLQKKSNKIFFLADNTEVKVEGSLFSGVKLNIGGEMVQISNSGRWYEFAIYIAGFVFLMVWSNSIALCSIIPMVGGAIGGLLYAIPAVLGFSVSVSRSIPSRTRLKRKICGIFQQIKTCHIFICLRLSLLKSAHLFCVADCFANFERINRVLDKTKKRWRLKNRRGFLVAV